MLLDVELLNEFGIFRQGLTFLGHEIFSVLLFVLKIISIVTPIDVSGEVLELTFLGKAVSTPNF